MIFITNFVIFSIISGLTKLGMADGGCRDKFTKMGFNGKYIHDSVYCTITYAGESYVEYLMYFSVKDLIPRYEIDILDVFCTITEFLQSQGFNGKYKEDIVTIKNHSKKIESEKTANIEEETKIGPYDEYLKDMAEKIASEANEEDTQSETSSCDEYSFDSMNHLSYYAATRTKKLSETYNDVVTKTAVHCRLQLESYNFDGVLSNDGPRAESDDSLEIKTTEKGLIDLPQRYAVCAQYAEKKMGAVENNEKINFIGVFCFHSNVLFAHDFNGSIKHDKTFNPAYKYTKVEADKYKTFLSTLPDNDTETNSMCAYALDIFTKRLESYKIDLNPLPHCMKTLQSYGYTGKGNADKDLKPNEIANSTANTYSLYQMELGKGYAIMIRHMKEKNINVPEDDETNTAYIFCNTTAAFKIYGFEGIVWYDTCYRPNLHVFLYGEMEELDKNEQNQYMKLGRNDTRETGMYRTFLCDNEIQPEVIYLYAVHRLETAIESLRTGIQSGTDEEDIDN